MDERDDENEKAGEPARGRRRPRSAGPRSRRTCPARRSTEPDDVGEVPAVEGAEAEEASVLPPQQVRAVLEALVFASPQPITTREIARVLQGVPREEWQKQLEELKADYGRDERGLQVVEIAGGYQVTTRPEYNDWVRELLDPARRPASRSRRSRRSP